MYVRMSWAFKLTDVITNRDDFNGPSGSVLSLL